MKKNQSQASNIEEITFGVEIETNIPIGVVAVGPYHYGQPVSGAPTFTGTAWKAERDGSIITSAGFEACEFVSPILKGEAGLNHLVDFVGWLNEIGARVNPSCGFHVHVGVASFCMEDNGCAADFVNAVARIVTQNATALYAQTGTLSREQGHYCMKPGLDYRRTVRQIARSKKLEETRSISRYHLLNVTTVATKGTVEFRCFAGTLNIEKVLLHVFSSIASCRVAATRKTAANWDGDHGTLSGSEALKNFLKVRPMWQIVSAPTFANHKSAMLAKGFEMANKYDAARNGAA